MSKIRFPGIKEKGNVIEDADSRIKKKILALKFDITANCLSTVIKKS